MVVTLDGLGGGKAAAGGYLGVVILLKPHFGATCTAM